jgi:ribonuclease Z
MKLLLLGTGGYFPNAQRHTACLMLPAVGVVLDAGTGMFRIAQHLVGDELDIYLTHAHLDHVMGLTCLLGVLRQRPMKRITVHALPEKLDAIRTHLYAEPLFPVPPQFELRPLAADIPLADGGRMRWFPLKHPGGSVGFRLDWPGHSMAYVTDTTALPSADYIQHIRSVDLLVHECYFPDSLVQYAEPSGHSFTSAVVDVARRAGVGRLVLVHVDPVATGPDPLGLAAAREIFPGVELARDEQEVEF